MYLLGESKPTANTFLGLGDENGSCLLSKLRMEDGGGEEASNAKVASEETTKEKFITIDFTGGVILQPFFVTTQAI
jgi:hypothetical protein